MTGHAFKLVWQALARFDQIRALGIFAILAGLPWSNTLMSVGTGLVFGGWCLGVFQGALSWKKPQVALGISLALAFGMGAAYHPTSSLPFWNDYNVKISLFLLLIGLSEGQNLRSLHPIFFRGGLLAYLLVSLAGSILFFQHAGPSALHFREASPWISNVRMGILGLGYLGMLWLPAAQITRVSATWRWGTGLWILGYLFLLQAYTALGIGGLLFTFWAIFNRNSPIWVRWGLPALSLVAVFGIYKEWTWVQGKPKPPVESWPGFSAGGFPYKYDTTSVQKENGAYIWHQVCPGELQSTWPTLSQHPLMEPLPNGHPLYLNLLRYLSSRHLPKDQFGLTQLSPDEIRAIENGTVNWLELQTPPWRFRLNQMLKSLDYFILTGDPMQESLTIRLFLWKKTWETWQTRFWLGHGPTDGWNQLAQSLKTPESRLKPSFHWMHPHHQWLSIGLHYGVLGVLLGLSLWAWVGWSCWRTPAFWWFSIFSLALFTEDMLETQAGVTQLAFFLTWLVFIPPHGKRT